MSGMITGSGDSTKHSLFFLPLMEVSVATSYFGSLCGLNVVDYIDCMVEFVALIREGLVTTV